MIKNEYGLTNVCRIRARDMCTFHDSVKKDNGRERRRGKRKEKGDKGEEGEEIALSLCRLRDLSSALQSGGGVSKKVVKNFKNGAKARSAFGCFSNSRLTPSFALRKPSTLPQTHQPLLFPRAHPSPVQLPPILVFLNKFTFSPERNTRINVSKQIRR